MIYNLLSRLSQSNIILKVENNALSIDAPKGILTEELLTEIRRAKTAIIEYLETNATAVLKKAEKRKYYVLSSAQKRMFFLNEIDPANLAYNMVISIPVEKNFNWQAAQKTLSEIIRRHDSLRASFRVIDETCYQIIHDDVDFRIEKISCEGSALSEKINALIRPFELDNAPLIRAYFIECPDKNQLVIDIHHIITDGVSQDLITKEVHLLSRDILLDVLPFQYKDYAVYQNSDVYQKLLLRKKNYWLSHFSQPLPPLNIPADHTRPPVKKYEGKSVRFFLPPTETGILRKIAEEQNATMFMIILALFKTFLFKLSGQDDITIGIPLSGRNSLALNSVVGMFINTLPFRSTFDREATFCEFLQDIKHKFLEVLENQEYQFDDLVAEANIERDTSRNPIYDVILEFYDKRDHKIEYPKQEDNRQFTHTRGYGQFDISLNVNDCGQFISFDLDYCVCLFEPSTIERFISYLNKLVQDICNNRHIRLSELSLITASEKQLILSEFNQTKVSWTDIKTIPGIFGEQARKIPDNIALRWDNQQLNYRELDILSDSISSYLIEVSHLKIGDIVGVMFEREMYLIPVILGILKAGGVYLPLDTNYPAERINAIFADSGLKALFTRRKFLKPAVTPPCVILDLDTPEIFSSRADNSQKVCLSGHDLAYVIYTSGSTGKPKGVMIEHESVVNRLNWMQQAYSLSEKDVLLQKTSIAFDVSVWELFWWSFAGASVYIPAPGVEKDPLAIIRTIQKYKITTLHFVPSMLANFLTYTAQKPDCSGLESLQKVFCSGEPLKPGYVREFGRTIHQYCGTRLINLYGPTEATVDVTYYECTFSNNESTIPIGKPISNTQLYILDPDYRPVPIGITGELYIAGLGLSRGYLNNELLTRERFFDNPLFPGSRVYRTGDLAKWRLDGNIEFLGRLDNQVKIRGYRIELGEIETALSRHQDIKESVVIVRESEEDKQLVAYYCSEKELTNLELKLFLSDRLPEFMLPAFFVRLAQFPVTLNGKLDAKALPLPKINSEVVHVLPVNEVEEGLLGLWSELSGHKREEISTTISFFEVGGHSLSATQLVFKIRKTFQAEITLIDFFKNPTIKGIASRISAQQRVPWESIPMAAPSEYYPLSSPQRRLYFLYQFTPDSLAYNIPQALLVDGALDRIRLQRTFRQLLLRHESLRASFHMIDGMPVQKIQQIEDFEIAYEEQNGVSPDLVFKAFVSSFILEKPPLFRIGLARLSDQTHLLMFDIHHIVSDGVSQGILIKEFMVLYNGEALPKTRLQYKDYAVWQQTAAHQDLRSLQKDFWLKEFSNPPEKLELPTDFPRQLVKGYAGNTLRFGLDVGETRCLKEMAGNAGSTLYMVLLAIYAILLNKLTGQEDIVIGTPVAGRQHDGLSETIGMFVNTLPLRFYPDDNLDFLEFLACVKDKTLSCFDHQGYQYEELIEDLALERDTSRNPLFDVMFSFQNFEDPELKIPGLVLSPYQHHGKISKFDLTLAAAEGNGQVFFNFEYTVELFREETIDRFITYFKKIVNLVIADPGIILGNIDILSEDEKDRISNQFNDTNVAFPSNVSLISLFETQVKKTPQNIALQYADFELSFFEFDLISRRIALYLTSKYNLKRGDLVGVLLEREAYLVPVIFGILRAGCAYVPIDPRYPAARKNAILTDAKVKVIISRSKHLKDPMPDQSVVADLEIVLPEIHAVEAEDIDVITCGSDLAYVIYTSGSTGQPKGVMVEHRAVVNRLLWMQNAFPIGERDAILQKTPIVFDVSVWELFWWSFTGARLVLIQPDEEKDPDAMIKVIEDQGITTLHFVPPMLEAFFSFTDTGFDWNRLRTLRLVFASGEALKREHVKLFEKTVHKNCRTRLINLYGPTEATVDVTFYECSFEHPRWSVPIGKPISNCRLFVLNKRRGLVPIGVAGELYIGGVALARGYLGNRVLTDAHFVSNPFGKEEKLYRTGDLAKWTDDGNLEFLGRIDHQVKIRGFRIELGEIESHLAALQNISDCIAVARERDGVKYLVAYYVSESPLEETQLKTFLASRLPVYMVPLHYVHLTKKPLTLNGKVDLRALPEPTVEKANDYVAPSNDFEQKLVTAWAEVLGIEPGTIGVHKSFFDLGGNSLKIIQLNLLINEILKKVVPITEMFRYPTIASFSHFILSDGSNTVSDAVKLNDEVIAMDGLINLFDSI